jgi:hypothetical protein
MSWPLSTLTHFRFLVSVERPGDDFPSAGGERVNVGIVAALALFAQTEELERTVRPFLQAHCVECHGERVRKADLRLDAPTTIRTWTRVLEVLRDGAMPPVRKPQPPAEDRAAAVSRITRALADAEASRVRLSGRTPLRRLNRAEYEYTLRDLLALPDLHVRDMLPADGEVNGFDTVAEALQVSEVQMARYLDAATFALEHAIVPRPRAEVPSVRRRVWEAGEGPVQGREFGTATRQVFVLTPPSGAQSPWRDTIQVPVSGMYRFRLGCFGAVWDKGQVRPADRPHVVSIVAAGRKGSGSRLLTTADVPAERGSVIEFTGRMDPSSHLDLVPETLVRRAIQDPSLHAGPAIGLEFLEMEGPLPEAWPPESHRLLTGERKPFVERAFRRPVSAEEGRLYAGLAPQAVLCSPDFLFRIEAPGPLDGFALASRLSYFLWCSMPDAELMSAAQDGRLTRPDVLRAQVERMLEDPRAGRFVEEFAGQWLELRKIEATQPDRPLYPEYDSLLLRSMVQETHAYLRDMIQQDFGVSFLIDSDFLFVNNRLARHYGIDGVGGVAIRRVPRPSGSPRGGLLTQASVLKVSSNGTSTSPVTRGAWVLDRLLGKPAPPPPSEVPAVEPDLRGAMTIREQLARHRTAAECASCHARIDPPGFALESFDVIGGWRDRYRSLGKGSPVDGVRYRLGLPVDSSGEVGGRSFKDIRDFKAILLEDRETLARNLAQRLIVTATGAPVGLSDRDVVEDILSRTRSRDYGFRSMIHEVVQSRLFRNK